MELVPTPEDDRIWIYNINRHFADFPEDKERRELIFNWFQDLEGRLSAQYKSLVHDNGSDS